MALVTIRRSSSVQSPRKADETEKSSEITEDEVCNHISKSLNECYFANKGAALVLGGSERAGAGGAGGAECELRRSPAAAAAAARAHPHPQTDIHHHLQAMFYLLRPEETLKMAVKLESAHAGRTRYLVVVCRGEEAALLGIDCNERTTVGLALRVLADTSIKLDGDGGFSVCVCGQQHIFKPVSVQAMWSALQTLHRASGRARALNHFAGGASHAWCGHYEARVDSDRSCLNEWHAMDSLESRRPPSPDSLRLKPREREETERVIRCTLKEVLMSVDLDEVTSKAIRGRLEDELDMDLHEYKSFIDQEMLTILGQMDAPTEVFDHVYLGSEWNASNLEELQRNGVRHILNVTREIDNFFPGMFDYLNVRVYDDDKTDLLKHWDNTFKYIDKARNEGSKVLVHCKMGISRSASVVIAYAMKAYNWNFDKALRHVKAKRSCIKPNNNFLSQLETYQGILDAMKNKEKLQRSKSETNLKAPKTVSKGESKSMEPTRLVLALTGSYCGRPRSWAPDWRLAGGGAGGAGGELLPPTSVSLENLALACETRHMLMPCAGGSYSVSPNQIMRLKEEGALSVKHIVSEIENAAGGSGGVGGAGGAGDRRLQDFARRSQRLHFGNQSESPSNRSSDASSGCGSGSSSQPEVTGKPPQVSPARNSAHKAPQPNFEANKIHTWDPGEAQGLKVEEHRNASSIDNIVKSDSGIIDVKTNKTSDAFCNSVERNLDLEEEAAPPSRQSSWSSFDSAGGPDLSRHSSWGAHETRAPRPPPPPPQPRATSPPPAPQRPASDLGSISERAGRALATIADNERKFNETCAILEELANAAARMDHARSRGASTWSGRLSASAPAATWLRAGPRRRRLAAASHGDLPRAHASAACAASATSAFPSSVASAVGIVSNLKKEFEARSESDAARPARTSSRAAAAPPPTPPPPADEDLSVRVLVGRYDQPGRARAPPDSACKKSRLGSDGEPRRASRSLRNSFCGAVRGERGERGERPPPAPAAPSPAPAPADYPSVVVSTVMSKAQNKRQLQHGKTHPLTRLNLNRSNNNRCSNSVYNTM